MSNNNIPVWEKYALSLSEAAQYFHIGEKRLRRLVCENENATFVFFNGNRVLIKRKLFEEYLNQTSVV